MGLGVGFTPNSWRARSTGVGSEGTPVTGVARGCVVLRPGNLRFPRHPLPSCNECCGVDASRACRRAGTGSIARPAVRWRERIAAPPAGASAAHSGHDDRRQSPAISWHVGSEPMTGPPAAPPRPPRCRTRPCRTPPRPRSRAGSGPARPFVAFAAKLAVQMRNRAYLPDQGRFLQADPNQSAMALLAMMAHSGQSLGASPGALDLIGRYGDGASLYQYLRCNPAHRHDPLGTTTGSFGELVGTMGIQGFLGGMILGGIAGGISGALNPNVGFLRGAAFGAGVGAVSGGVGGAVAGGMTFAFGASLTGLMGIAQSAGIWGTAGMAGGAAGSAHGQWASTGSVDSRIAMQDAAFGAMLGGALGGGIRAAELRFFTGTFSGGGIPHIDPRKIEYLLNNKSKSGFFRGLLGFNEGNSWLLVRQVEDAWRYSVKSDSTVHGVKFTAPRRITGANGREANVIVVFQIDHGATVPRLVTVSPN